MEESLISVVMATYNEPPEIIGGAINSILNQTYKNIELLILDDSTDIETKKVIDSYYNNMKVRIIRKKERMGFINALNEGLELAKGEFIARMDGDDISYPYRFARQIEYMKLHPEVTVLGGSYEIMDYEENSLSYRKYPTKGLKLTIYAGIRCPVAHPTVMMRRKVVDEGYRYDTSLRVCEDLDFWLRLMNKGCVIDNIPDTILRYRLSKNFNEKRSTKSQISTLVRVREKNLCWKYPLRSIISLLFILGCKCMPQNVIKKIYGLENKNV